mgnify:CR=1 FL=1
MFMFQKKKLSSVFENKKQPTYIDINSKIVFPSDDYITIKVTNKVYLYTGSNTFSGVFQFLKEWNLNGKKVWGSDELAKILGYTQYGLFKMGDTDGGMSLEEKFKGFSSKDMEAFEVDNIDGYCKTFGWSRSLEINKCNTFQDIKFQYKCTSCKSTCKKKFTDSRFLYTTGILYQKSRYIFGDVIVNPLHNFSTINALCWDCKQVNEYAVDLFRCKCGSVKSSTGYVNMNTKAFNGIYDEFKFKTCEKTICMDCVEKIIECYVV